MNEKIKKIFIGIGVFFSGLITCLFFTNRKHDRRTDTDRVIDNNKQSTTEATTAEGAIGASQSINSELKEESERAEQLINELRKRAKERNI